MQPEFVDTRNDRQPSAPTARDVVAIIFRQKKILIVSFVAILLGIVLSGVLMPRYQAQMKILVRRERVDPVVTSQSNAPLQFGREEVTEAELNSEVELLNSRDLLRKVVLATGLQDHESGSEEIKAAKAIRRLANKLKIDPLRKTNVIAVTYESSDPSLASKILSTLADLYVEKHLEVHRPSGEFKFFDQQTEQYRKGLQLAEQQLTDFTRQHGTVSAQMERDITLQKLSEFEAVYRQTQAAIAEADQRIHALEQQQMSLPGRVTTQVRTSDNPQLLQQMKSTLLTLELKRTELLTKYDPGYRLVQELDKEIADTRAAITAEEKAPLHEQTTDQNPTSLWVNSELAKARTDLSALKAKASATNGILSSYQQSARELQESALVQQDLLRAARTAEENYLLYQRKEEEARINDALDQRGILNVAIAEQPTVPALPIRSSLRYALLSVLLAGVVSLGMAFTADFLDPSFRTPAEVTAYLGAPVLIAIPRAALPKPSRAPLRNAGLVVAAVLSAGVLGALAGLYAGRAHLALMQLRLSPKWATVLSHTSASPVPSVPVPAADPTPASDVPTPAADPAFASDALEPAADPALASDVPKPAADPTPTSDVPKPPVDAAHATDTPRLAAPEQELVVVGPHQTLTQISRLYLGEYNAAVLSKLRALNPGLGDPNHLEVGQQIRLPIAAGGESGGRREREQQQETPRNPR